MKTLTQRLTLFLWILAATLSSGASAAPSDFVTEWKFRVLLDGKDIGHHRFTLLDTGAEQRMESEASFDARILMLLKFKYRHTNNEVWRDDCLAEIESQTVTNGKTASLAGYREPGAFVIAANNQEQRLPECVKTFAYWDSGILQEDRLLNPQTGRYQPISIEPMDTQSLSVRGENVLAQRYRLSGEKLQLDVWYSDDGEWLQLESRIKGGRLIRYQLT